MRLKINNLELEVEIVEMEEDKARGLSGRESLEKNRGMLFVHPSPQIRKMAMRDMKFPIDIMWIDENLKVIGFEQNLLPESYPQTFQPPSPIKMVLEVNAGITKKFDIKIGDTAALS